MVVHQLLPRIRQQLLLALLLRHTLRQAREDSILRIVAIQADQILVAQDDCLVLLERIPRVQRVRRSALARTPQRWPPAFGDESRGAIGKNAHDALHARHRQSLLDHVPATENSGVASAKAVW
eukprot:605820-Prymnesium_polylepis.1